MVDISAEQMHEVLKNKIIYLFGLISKQPEDVRHELKLLQQTEVFGLVLAEIWKDASCCRAYRRQAKALLQELVNAKWKQISKKKAVQEEADQEETDQEETVQEETVQEETVQEETVQEETVQEEADQAGHDALLELCLLLRRNPEVSEMIPSLSTFMEVSAKYLKNYNDVESSNKLKTDIIKTMILLKRRHPSRICECHQLILQAVLDSLKTLAEDFKPFAIAGFRDHKKKIRLRQADCEETRRNLELGDLIQSLFDFIQILVKASLRPLRIEMEKALEQIFEYLIEFMQLTEEEERERTNNVNHWFVVQEKEEEELIYSVRVSAKNLLMSVYSAFPNIVGFDSLYRATQKQIKKAEAMQKANNSKWWTLVDAAFLAIKIASECVSRAEGTQYDFCIQQLLANIIQSKDAPDILIGRAIKLASQLGLPTEELWWHIVEASYHRGEWVRMCGAEWLFHKLHNLKFLLARNGLDCEKRQEDIRCLQKWCKRLIHGICSVLETSHSDKMKMSLLAVFEVEQKFNLETVEAACEDVLGVMYQAFPTDQVVVWLCQQVIALLVKNESNISVRLQKVLLQTSVSILRYRNDTVKLWMKDVSLDIICCLIERTYKAGANKTLRDEPVIEDVISAIPTLMKKILQPNDPVLQMKRSCWKYQNEKEEQCLKLLLKVAKEKIRYWKDTSRGLGCLYKVLSRVMDSEERVNLRDDDRVFFQYAISKQFSTWNSYWNPTEEIGNITLYTFAQRIAGFQRKLTEIMDIIRDNFHHFDPEEDPSVIVKIQWFLEDELDLYMNKELLCILMIAENPDLHMWFFNWINDVHLIDALQVTTPRAGVAVFDGKHILLVKGFHGMFNWSVPKGKIEEEENEEEENEEEENEEEENEEEENEEEENEEEGVVLDEEEKGAALWTAMKELYEETGLDLMAAHPNPEEIPHLTLRLPSSGQRFTLFCVIGVFDVNSETMPRTEREIEATC